MERRRPGGITLKLRRPTRIISARWATKREQRMYQNYIEHRHE